MATLALFNLRACAAFFLGATVAAFAAGCEGDGVRDVVALGVAEPRAIDFGLVYVGDSRTHPVVFRNLGNVPLTNVEAVVDDGDAATFAIATEGQREVAPGETVTFQVSFVPLQSGEGRGAVNVTTSEAEPVSVSLSAVAIVPRECNDDNPCTADAFDFESTECVFTPVNLSQPCDDANACTTDSFCAEGTCRGQGVNCPPPSTPCVVSLCSADEGCVEVPNDVACDDGDPCTDDRCIIGTGCSSTLSPNGTPCGPRGQCDVNALCADGVCTDFPIPDGSPCFDDDVCTVNDQCTNSVCVGERVAADMEMVGRAFTFGGRDSLVGITGAREHVFADDYADGTRLTLAHGDPFPAAAVRDRIGPIEPIDALAVIGDWVLLMRGGFGPLELEVYRIESGANLVEAGRLVVDMGASPAAAVGQNLVGLRVAGADDTAVLCSGTQSIVVALELRDSGPVEVGRVPLARGTTCADVAVDGDDVAIAEQNIREEAPIPPPGVVSRWTLGPGGLALDRVIEIDERCTAFATQPLLVAFLEESLAIACGTGVLNAVSRISANEVFVVGRVAESLAEATEVELEAAQSLTDMARGEDQIHALVAGAVTSQTCTFRGGDTSLRDCAGTIARPGPQRHAGRFAVGGGRVATVTEDGVAAEVFAEEAGFGVLGELATHNGVHFSLSKSAVHQFSIVDDAIVWSGGRTLFGVDEPGIFAFGGGTSGPYLVQPSAKEGAVYDASNPSAPFLASRIEGLRPPFAASKTGTTDFIVGDGVFEEGEQNRAKIVHMTPTPTIGPLWSEEHPLDGAFLGDNPMQVRVMGDFIGLLYAADAASSVEVVLDGRSAGSDPPVTEGEILSRVRPGVLPVDLVSNGEGILTLRGEPSGGTEVPGSSGRVEWRPFGSTEAPLNDALPFATKVLWAGVGRAFVATRTGLAYVEFGAGAAGVVQVLDFDRPPIGVTFDDGRLVVALENEVRVFSPPCPSAP